MGNIRYHIKTVFLAVFVIMSACNCEPPAQGGESEKSRIFLRLSPSGLPTRASDGSESKEDGNTLENYIDPSDIRICFFGNDGILKSVVFEGDSAGGDMTGGDGNLSVDVEVASSEFGDEGIVKVLAIANLNGFVGNLDFTVGETTFDDVKNIVLSVPADQNAVTRIPMIGEASVSISEIGVNTHVDVLLNRMLAKIEVVDGLADDGYEIESVSLSATGETAGNGASSTMEIAFSQDGNKFRAYVPKRKLGDDVKGSDRRITLNVRKTDSTDTEPYYIYLSKYGDDGEPCADEAEAWNTLLPNRIYRFTVTSLKPTLQVQDKIAVVWDWSDFYHGKFRNYYIRFYDKEASPLTSVLKANTTGFGDFYIGYVLDLNDYGCNYDGLYYRIFESQYGNPISELSNISEDAVKILDENGRTSFYLNGYPMGTLGSYQSAGVYPTECAYRFYCRRTDAFQILIWVSNYTFNSDKKYETFKTDSRGYNYVEFNMKSNFKFHNAPLSDNGILFTIKDEEGNIILDGDRLDDNAVFNQHDIFEQEIDGRKYYVFYLD